MEQGSAVGVLYQKGKVLVERRHIHERFFPGGVMFPGGNIDDHETPEQGLIREMKEELGITVRQYSLVGNFYHDDGHKMHIFLITEWEGSPQALEADEVFWIDDEMKITDQKNREIYHVVKNMIIQNPKPPFRAVLDS